MLTGLWCLLGGWVGCLLLFAVVIAPTAFSALPSPDLAGKVVGPVLRSLNLYGMTAGPVLALVAWRLRRGKLLVLLPLALAASAAIAEFGITATIESIRSQAFGPEPDAAALQRFGQLHRIAVGLFACTGIGATLLACLHGWAQAGDVKKARESVSL